MRVQPMARLPECTSLVQSGVQEGDGSYLKHHRLGRLAELDEFVLDISSGVADWRPRMLTAAPPAWGEPLTRGSWLGASGYNPRLAARHVAEQRGR